MESSQIFGEQFMNLLREQAKEAYLEGVKDGKKSLKNRGFGNITEAQKMSGYGKRP
jgi:hypothetical protein